MRALRAVVAPWVSGSLVRFALAVTTGELETGPLEELPTEHFDHLWMTSVLNDPEAFPALHDELYERHGSDLATGKGDLEVDRVRAGELLRSACRRVRSEFVYTTTDEELPFVEAEFASDGLALEPLTPAVLSAFVGDPVRIFRVSSS